MFAHEQGGENGVNLFPKDPIQAAKLRVDIENFGKFLQPLFGVMMSRGEDQEANKKLEETIIAFNEIIAKANGNFLFGTEEPSMLDVYYAPFLEIIYLWQAPSVMANILEDCNFKEKGTHIVAYVEKWRNHPLVKSWKMN